MCPRSRSTGTSRRKDEIVQPAASKAQKDRYADAVWQVAVRTLHEVFEADRAGKIHSIALTVGVDRLAPATGLPETVPLAWSSADRERSARSTWPRCPTRHPDPFGRGTVEVAFDWLRRIRPAAAFGSRGAACGSTPAWWPTPPEGWTPPAGWQPDPVLAGAAAGLAVVAPRRGRGPRRSLRPDPVATPGVSAAKQPEDLPSAGQRMPSLRRDSARHRQPSCPRRSARSSSRRRARGRPVLEERVGRRRGGADDQRVLQDVGIYRYHHPLEDAAAYKDRLRATRVPVDEFIKAGRAVLAADMFTFDGSLGQGPQDGRGPVQADAARLQRRGRQLRAVSALGQRLTRQKRLESSGRRRSRSSAC